VMGVVEHQLRVGLVQATEDIVQSDMVGLKYRRTRVPIDHRHGLPMASMMIAAGLAHTAGLIHAAGAGLRPTSTTRLLNPSVKLARKRLTLCSFEATVVTARAGVIPAGEARTWAIPAG
jgi:hypothetical protein